MLTQHISPEIMKKAAGGGGGAAMVIENLLMKTNLKLGGVNYFLVTSYVVPLPFSLNSFCFSPEMPSDKRRAIRRT